MALGAPTDLVANAASFTEVIGASGNWTHEGSNIWSRSLTTECTSVRFDSTTWGKEDASPDKKYEWDWASDELLVYSVNNPTGYYSSIETTSGYTNQIDLSWTLGDTYAYVNIEHKQVGGSWSFEGQVTGSVTTWEHEDVKKNVLHKYRAQGVSGGAEPEFSPYSNTDSAACWSDTITDEIVTSEFIDEYKTAEDVSDTITDTMYVSDFAVDAKEIITNYAYYVATADGKVYEYSGFYKSDAGTSIAANWESKDTDFADQNIEWADRFKTIEKVRLHYIDKSAGARVSIKVSTDGGASWTTKTRNIGTGDTKGKTADFFLIKTGQIFRFAIENDSATDDFQFVGLEVFYSVGGDYFEI